jgi:hypothetical protein
MERASRAAADAAKPLRVRASAVAAYREGLGAAGIAIIREAAGARVAVIGPGDANPDADPNNQICWWCRRAADAERVVSAAGLRMRRLESRASGGSSPRGLDAKDSHSRSLASDAVLAAARRRRVLLQSDEEVTAEAAVVVERVDAEVERMRQSGELRSVNREYRDYRLAATARGERVMRYGEWMRKYKDDLVREAARKLRHF